MEPRVRVALTCAALQTAAWLLGQRGKMAERRGPAPRAVKLDLRSTQSRHACSVDAPDWWARRELHSYGLLPWFLRPVRLLFRHVPEMAAQVGFAPTPARLTGG